MMDLDAIKQINERATRTGERAVGWERSTGLNSLPGSECPKRPFRNGQSAPRGAKPGKHAFPKRKPRKVVVRKSEKFSPFSVSARSAQHGWVF